MLLGKDSSEDTYYGNGLFMNQKEARQCILDSWESDSLTAVIGINSDKVADNLYSSDLKNMHGTIVEMANNHSESPDIFLNMMFNHLLEEKSTPYDILASDFAHPYNATVKMINDINSTLVTDRYGNNITNLLDKTRRRMALYDNFDGIIENLRKCYSGKDFLILMKVSCNTVLTGQAMQRLRKIVENPYIKIVLFIEMTPGYYNQIRENNMFDGFFDSEIYLQEE